jgi:hypothetical protein
MQQSVAKRAPLSQLEAARHLFVIRLVNRPKAGRAAQSRSDALLLAE